MVKKSFNLQAGLQDVSGPRLLSQRFFLSYYFFLGTFCLYIMRANMSMAIVCMTNDGAKENETTDINVTETPPKDDCPNQDIGGGPQREGEFDWDRSLRGFILSSFYIGYLLTQFPAGWFAKKLGCKNLVLIGMSTLCISTLLTAVCARASVYLLIVIQIIKGGASGLYFPSMYQLWGFWAPPTDRSALVAISHAGASIGSVFSSSISGLLCANGFDGGWPSIFYIYGTISSFWCLGWFFIGYDRPAEHPRISPEERDYIESSLGNQNEKKNLSVPWSKLLKCVPFYALLFTNVCYSWGWFTALNVLPQYMKDVLKFNIKANGLYNALPYLCNFLLTVLGSFMADGILRKGFLSRTWTRKLMTSLALFPTGVIAIATGFLNCHQIPLAITVLTFWVGVMGFCRSGSIVNVIDLAPAYAGVMNGMVQTIVTIPGVIAPTVTGIMTPEGKAEEWRNVFFMGAGIALSGWLVYMILGQGEEQEWAKQADKKQQNQTSMVTNRPIEDNASQYKGQINETFEEL